MIINGSVTIHHYDEENESYKARFFPNAHIYKKIGIQTEKAGKGSAVDCKIRIYTGESIDIAVGDYVFTGKAYSDIPDKEKCLAVTDYSDNRHSVQQHWRVHCE